MFSVYKITNKINNKCYIGSSIRVEKRWKEHKIALLIQIIVNIIIRYTKPLENMD